MNWKSLTQPAILPLTTDYVPPIKLMDRSYDVNNVYQLLVDKQESPFLTSEDLMQELICLRLTQVALLSHYLCSHISAPQIFSSFVLVMFNISRKFCSTISYLCL